MITDMINNKKLNSIVTDIFIRCRKLTISLIFISQSYLIYKFQKMSEKIAHTFLL